MRGGGACPKMCKQMDYLIQNLTFYITNAAIDFGVYISISVMVGFIQLLIMIVQKQRFVVKLCEFFLILYLYIVFSLTVLIRPNTEEYHSLIPFWTYVAVANGKQFLIYEIAENVLLLMPAGFLFALLNLMESDQAKAATANQKMVLRHFVIRNFYLICFSVAIEACQYFNHIGLAEFDDVFHNTVGALIGYGTGLKVGKKLLSRRKDK